MNKPQGRYDAAAAEVEADPDGNGTATKGKMGPVRERHENIRRIVQAKGFVTIEFLVQEFGVTPQTIRRDLNMLSRAGLVRRYHGGAGLPPSTENVAYTQRKVMCLREKNGLQKCLPGIFRTMSLCSLI